MTITKRLMGMGVAAGAAQETVGSVAATVSAAGTTQADATNLGFGVNVVTTVASGAGVKLYINADRGDWQVVYNNGANALAVYPPTSNTINGGSANAAYTVAVGSVVSFQKVTDTAWVGVSGDAASSNFTPSGTGAVTRTVQAKEREIVSVTDFGCALDGTTDDTSSYQAAITAVSGSRVWLYHPPGTAKITSGLTVSGAFRLTGASRETSAISWTSTTLDVFTVASNNAVAFENLSFSGPLSATAGSIIQISGSSTENSHSRFRDCKFAQGYNHLKFLAASTFTVDNCQFTAYVNNGIYVSNTNNVDSGDSTIINSVFANGGASSEAIHHVSSGGLRVMNNKLLGGAYGYRMQLASGAATGNLLLTGNSIENQTTAAIAATTDGGGATYANLVITGNQVNNAPTPILFNDATAFLSKIAITGNCLTLSSAGTVGITITNASDFIIDGNQITGTGGTPIGISIGASCGQGRVGLNQYKGLTQNRSIASTSVIGPPPQVIASSAAAVNCPADTSEDTLLTVTVPANILETNGYLTIHASWTFTNNANAKTVRVRYSGAAGTAYYENSFPNLLSAGCELKIHNRNSTSSQVGASAATGPVSGFGSSTNALPTSSVDTTADTTIVFTAQKANGADTITLERATVTIFPGMS